MPLSTLFQLYRGGQYYWWKKREYVRGQISNDHSHVSEYISDYISNGTLEVEFQMISHVSEYVSD
jgi:hypothetical protein